MKDARRKENRCRLARKNAGLTLGQAARLFGVMPSDISGIELGTIPLAHDMEAAMCDRYGVNAEWLRGDTDRRDSATIDALAGADKLSFHDRDIVAEFAAAMPRQLLKCECDWRSKDPNENPHAPFCPARGAKP